MDGRWVTIGVKERVERDFVGKNIYIIIHLIPYTVSIVQRF
jgi:hypothetical protein